MSQLYKPRLPKAPANTFKQPKVPETPEEPTFPALSPGFTTNDDFEQRYQQWNRGTRAEFVTWDYLTNQLRLNEGSDFNFMPNTFTAETTRFTIGGLLWRINGETMQASPSALALERMRLENQGYVVVDLKAQDLQLGHSNAVLGEAIKGQET